MLTQHYRVGNLAARADLLYTVERQPKRKRLLSVMLVLRFVNAGRPTIEIQKLMNSKTDRRSRQRVVTSVPVRVRSARRNGVERTDSRCEHQWCIPIHRVSDGGGLGGGIGSDSSS